jgi:hypothetical protein
LNLTTSIWVAPDSSSLSFRNCRVSRRTTRPGTSSDRHSFRTVRTPPTTSTVACTSAQRSSRSPTFTFWSTSRSSSSSDVLDLPLMRVSTRHRTAQ